MGRGPGRNAHYPASTDFLADLRIRRRVRRSWSRTPGGLAQDSNASFLCDVVVCLSHLGFRIKNGVCDEKLAAETKGIDVILGGHSHTFMEKPAFFLNAEGKSIPVLHTGKNGIFVGELDLTLSEEE